MSELNPPFTLGIGASDYRRLDPASDPWQARTRYCIRRDEALAAYRLHSHDPRLWRVNVPTGGEHGGTKDIQLLRCETCGVSTILPGRPVRSRQRLDLDICTPVSSEEMAAVVLNAHRKEKLSWFAIFGVGFAVLAILMLGATLNAPPLNRSIGYLGVIFFASVSVAWWVSFWKVLRDERIRQEWKQRSEDAASNPTGDFVSRDSVQDADHE